MLPIKLLHPVSRRVETRGPVHRVVVTGDVLIFDEQEVAVYANGFWVFKGQPFTTVSIESRVTVHFEDETGKASPKHGPFDQLKVVDGALRHGDEFKETLAHFDAQTKRWEVYPESTKWLTALIVPG